MACSLYNTIKCNDSSTELSSNRAAILKALQYCDAHGTYKAEDVSDALKNEGLPDHFVLACQGHGADSSGSGAYKHWSYWKIGDKKYTIFTYSNAVDNNNKNVVCNNEGTETTSSKEKISRALETCKAENKYKCGDVAKQLKSIGLKGCIVIGAQDTGIGVEGTAWYSKWSYWRIGTKEYTILSYD